jgi:hypothetical protein
MPGNSNDLQALPVIDDAFHGEAPSAHIMNG